MIEAKYIGYWNRTWASSAAPAGANFGAAFSGWANPLAAVEQSAPIRNSLAGSKFITLGGGNANGAFTSDTLAAVTQAIVAGSFAGYDGIAYDVEEGSSGLASMFQQSFAAAKANRFKVLVTVSHSAPYGIADAAALMQAFLADPNIDFLSPQLYTTGSETANNYVTAAGVQWSDYAGAQASVVPSIVHADLYPGAVTYFASQGVSICGFMQWAAESV